MYVGRSEDVDVEADETYASILPVLVLRSYCYCPNVTELEDNCVVVTVHFTCSQGPVLPKMLYELMSSLKGSVKIV